MNKKLHLSMVGDMRMRPACAMEGRMKTCTILKDVDKWYACIVAEVRTDNVQFSDRPSVGVDLGVSPFVALSDGTTIAEKKFLRCSEARIKALQRSLSRKKERGLSEQSEDRDETGQGMANSQESTE